MGRLGKTAWEAKSNSFSRDWKLHERTLKILSRSFQNQRWMRLRTGYPKRTGSIFSSLIQLWVIYWTFPSLRIRLRSRFCRDETKDYHYNGVSNPPPTQNNIIGYFFFTKQSKRVHEIDTVLGVHSLCHKQSSGLDWIFKAKSCKLSSRRQSSIVYRSSIQLFLDV